MAKKWFCVSDIHSFFIEFKEALYKAGFRKNNKEHMLIVVGDLWDRGPDTIALYNYLKSIPKYRRVMIKGNHEDLYLELLDKSYPENHDFSNHTVSTFCQIANEEEWKLDPYKYYDKRFDDDMDFKKPSLRWNRVKEKVGKHPITKWLKSDEWVNYYELGPFIFTHSFVPVKVKEEYKQAAKILTEFNISERCFEYNPDWRNANAWDWYVARWGCPYKKYENKLFLEDKSLVVGHWHTSAFYEYLDNDYRYSDEPSPIYYSKGLIGLDGGVYRDPLLGEYVHPQNVLVIDENWNCYDQDDCLLKENSMKSFIETVPADSID